MASEVRLLLFLLFSLFTSTDTTAPTIDSLSPKVYALYQYETSSVTVSTVTCSDPDGGTCSVSLRVYPSNPCGNCFTILPCGTSYCIKYLPGTGFFTPSVEPQYLLTVTATDDQSESDPVTSTDVVDVRIVPNALPVFGTVTTPIWTDTKTINNAQSVNSGDIIYTVPADDPEGDALTYTMTTVPYTDNLEIDSLSGYIRATSSLKAECHSNIAAQVYVQDSVNTGTQVGPFVVSLQLDGANAPPIINNLNSELRVREDEAVGTTVMTFAMFDEDPQDGVTYTVTTSPASAANLFEIPDGKDELVVKSALDYETQPQTITMSITASDGYCTSETYTLTIKLVDINEPPTLGPIDQTVESCEGFVDIVPNWNATDVDVHDQVRFIGLAPNDDGRFKIDEVTGVVSTIVDYDVDQNNMPPTVEMVTTISDRQGLTATATLTVRFIDCNDNAPIFDKNTYLFESKDCFPAGSILGKLNADDLDSEYEQNNVITFSGSTGGVEVQPGGTVVTTADLSAGFTATFQAWATDKGKTPGPLTSTNPAYVSVHVLPCTTPPPPSETETTTTTAAPDLRNIASFLDNNLGWIIAAGLAAALLTALSLYMLYRYCWFRITRCFRGAACCKKSPPARISRTPVRRPTPPPEETKPGFIFGWWKEKYPNDDYNRMPDRNALPEPSQQIDTPVETNTYDVDPVVPRTPPPPPPSKTCIIL